jgi:hypothetical protein
MKKYGKNAFFLQPDAALHLHSVNKLFPALTKQFIYAILKSYPEQGRSAVPIFSARLFLQSNANCLGQKGYADHLNTFFYK